MRAISLACCAAVTQREAAAFVGVGFAAALGAEPFVGISVR